MYKSYDRVTDTEIMTLYRGFTILAQRCSQQKIILGVVLR
jgi:hypothetical protein